MRLFDSWANFPFTTSEEVWLLVIKWYIKVASRVAERLKRVSMKITTFLISKTKQIYAKTLTVLESAYKGNATFCNLLTSVAICKQRFLNENKTVQHLL